MYNPCAGITDGTYEAVVVFGAVTESANRVLGMPVCDRGLLGDERVRRHAQTLVQLAGRTIDSHSGAV